MGVTKVLIATMPLLASAAQSCAFFVDAGSTGSRLYGVVDIDNKIDMYAMKKAKPGISTIAPDVAKAHDYLMEVLKRGQEMESKGCVLKNMPLTVMATAGMRSLKSQGQWTDEEESKFWEDLRQTLIDLGDDYPYDASDIRMRTITGHAEGLYALIAANYLAGTMTPDLEVTGSYHGVLDLGGSSTQLAMFAKNEVSRHEHMSVHTSPLTDTIEAGAEDPMVFVRSFPSMGMEAIFAVQKEYYISQQRVELGNNNLEVSDLDQNPCRYQNGAECYKTVVDVFAARACPEEAHRQDCFNSQGILNHESMLTHKKNLFAISAFFYVADFARWWFDRICDAASIEAYPCESGDKEYLQTYPQVTPNQLKYAGTRMCNQTVFNRIVELTQDPTTKHEMTGPNKAPDRCFELNYIAVILEQYGLDDSTPITVADEIEGAPLEWTMGAYLQQSLETPPVVGSDTKTEL